MSTIDLTAADGHRFSAWKASPAGKPKGAVVVIQEIFGVNSHIRSVADGYAADGYLALAPALFDRIERHYETGYEAADIAAGRERVARLDWTQTLADVAATIAAARDYADGARVGLVGYCWGGTVAWRAASLSDGLAASASYYGGMIGQFTGEAPRVPVQLHLGAKDTTPTPETGEALASRYADRVELFVYEAGHGFNCDQRASFDPHSAALARERVLAFFDRHLAG